VGVVVIGTGPPLHGHWVSVFDLSIGAGGYVLAGRVGAKTELVPC
jgi:hypothetical protein